MDEPVLFVLLPAMGLLFFRIWVGEWLRWGMPFGLPRRQRRPLLGALAAALLLLWTSLQLWSALDVRTAAFYLFGYWGLGLAWLCVCLARLFPFLGLDPRHEALERRNTATIWAFGGAAFGAIFCYAGSNIGSGPGWWVVFFCLLLSTLHWLVSWWLLDAITQITDVITIDRDRAAGIRLGGFLLATGLIAGRAVAGDWTSVSATLYDFLCYGWPALVVLLVVAVAVERIAQPTVNQPIRARGRYGLLPAGIYISGALLFVVGSLLWRNGW